ncbi:MAG: hypothetical protein IJK88_06615 [Clostridia bacterium]|nr:hypothetical protein [Clostridia bacterium]
MKRLLCMILTGLMLFAAACTAAPKPQTSEVPTDPPAAPTDEPVPETTPEPTAQPSPSDEDLFVPEVTPEPDPGADEPTPEPYEPTGDAEFAFALAARLLDGKQNRNLSPVSVYLAMAMVAEGANGETLEELLKLLGVGSLEELRGVCAALLETLSIDLEESTLDLHNSLWMSESIGGMPVTFREAFLTSLGTTYRSEAHTVDFGNFTAGKQIADWITEHTRGKIKISPDAMHFEPETLAVLINTIYLKDVWSEPFDSTRTEQGIFHGLDDNGAAEDRKVDYMSRFDRNVLISQGDGWIRYRVYLRAVGWVSFVLPDEGIDLEKLLGTPEAIEKLLYAGINKTCNVSLRIPKFSFQDKMDLDGVLRVLGLAHCFSEGADFSNMSDTSCKIDRVLQESYIGVDENGVEAAAYTMVSMRATGYYNPVELETIEFHLTRPFFYAIESYDGTLLFVGTVTTPSEAESIHK